MMVTAKLMTHCNICVQLIQDAVKVGDWFQGIHIVESNYNNLLISFCMVYTEVLLWSSTDILHKLELMM